MKYFLTFLLIGIFGIQAFSQFHTLKIPKASPYVSEHFTLGITDIEISYHSPACKGRNVWAELIPFDGEPIPWRVGANMNTKVAFSTDIIIGNKSIPKGSYGLHMIPRKDSVWSVILANNDNLWGSYYLDLKSDVHLVYDTKPEYCEFSENLDFEFWDLTDSTVNIVMQWDTVCVKIPVTVDLNKTVINSFRYELRGINTYRWEAWNDAAKWCLNRKTNLDEALEWSNRSIEGGYGGFASDRNFENLFTKSKILFALERSDEGIKTIEECTKLYQEAWQAFDCANWLIANKRVELSLNSIDMGISKFPDIWYLPYLKARILYGHKSKKSGIKLMKAIIKMAPERNQSYIQGLITKMEKSEDISGS